MTEEFHRVIAEDELEEGGRHAVFINDWPVLVVRDQGQLHAFINKCTHANSELANGRVRRGTVMCPLHGARFELATGRCIGGPYRPLKLYESRIVDGWIEVAVPEKKPGLEHRLFKTR